MKYTEQERAAYRSLGTKGLNQLQQLNTVHRAAFDGTGGTRNLDEIQDADLLKTIRAGRSIRPQEVS